MLGSWEENILMTLSELLAAARDGMLQQKYLCFDYLYKFLTLFHVCNAELIALINPEGHTEGYAVTEFCLCCQYLIHKFINKVQRYCETIYF